MCDCEHCVVCGAKLSPTKNCDCEDPPDSHPPGLVPIDFGKTESDKLSDGFFLQELSEEDGNYPYELKKYTTQKLKKDS